MSALESSMLSRDEARSLTDEVKRDGERLWRKLVELYEGLAHEALGYRSWASYCEEEFGFKQAQAYRLLHAGQAASIIGSGNGRLPNVEQAQELRPLRAEPEKLRDAWAEASADGAPTALKVREAVQRALPPVSEEAREKQRRWAATMNVLDGLAHFDRPASPEQAEAEASLIDQRAAASRGESITPERLRNASAWAALLADALERTHT